MLEALFFKVLQRQLKFRNPNHLVKLPDSLHPTSQELKGAEDYLNLLLEKNISWTHPGHSNYPQQFYKMKEPPLFLEFSGKPFWKNHFCLSVVGSRKIHPLTKEWMSEHLAGFLEKENVCLVSGGAIGVDQWAHSLSLKKSRPTVAILPSGLANIYPRELPQLLRGMDSENSCFVSEFEQKQVIQKSNFFHRNRLISALGEIVLIVQAETRSGSLLTVHHALENGRPVATLPSHPSLVGFSGNLKLLQEGAVSVSSELDLLELWNGEKLANQWISEGG